MVYFSISIHDVLLPHISCYKKMRRIAQTPYFLLSWFIMGLIHSFIRMETLLRNRIRQEEIQEAL